MNEINLENWREKPTKIEEYGKSGEDKYWAKEDVEALLKQQRSEFVEDIFNIKRECTWEEEGATFEDRDMFMDKILLLRHKYQSQGDGGSGGC